MKKIIIAFTMLVFGTVSAHAIDRSIFSVTAGIAANQGVFGASAKETNLTDTNTTGHVKKESGVFTDSFGSQFLELGIGEWISLGYEHTPDSVTTPTNGSSRSPAPRSAPPARQRPPKRAPTACTKNTPRQHAATHTPERPPRSCHCTPAWAAE